MNYSTSRARRGGKTEWKKQEIIKIFQQCLTWNPVRQSTAGGRILPPTVPAGGLIIFISWGENYQHFSHKQTAPLSSLIGRAMSRLGSDWLISWQLSYAIKTQLKAPKTIDSFCAWKPPICYKETKSQSPFGCLELCPYLYGIRELA